MAEVPCGDLGHAFAKEGTSEGELEVVCTCGEVCMNGVDNGSTMRLIFTHNTTKEPEYKKGDPYHLAQFVLVEPEEGGS